LQKNKKGFPIILFEKTTKSQFKTFCEKNKPKTMEDAINFFSVFGGLDIEVDTTKPLKDEIKKHILNNYAHLKSDINALTGGYGVSHAILTGIALGDRRTNTSFKKAHVSFEEGMKNIEDLCDRGVIEIESSLHYLADKRGDDKVAKRLLFTTPFTRFWFAFVSPIYKGISEKNYKEFDQRFDNRIEEFTDFVFEELAMEYIKEYYKENGIKSIGKYWDNSIEIDIVAKTNDGKVLVADCINSKNKVKKASLTTLQSNSKKAGFKADITILFAKDKFSTEVKNLKSDSIKLFNSKSLKLLID
jgi:AAA+ ATPase superfamily predicted ATPase